MNQSAFSDVRIETTLPRPWEEEESFHDVLYDWMQRAPWFAISAAAHFIVFLILQAVPWSLFVKEELIEIQASIETPTEVFEEPPEEEIIEEPEEEIVEEPVIQDVEVEEQQTEDFDELFETSEGDLDALADSPFEDAALNDLIGIGGGAGSKFGKRFGDRGRIRQDGGSGTEQALKDGLEWLAAHQSPDGSWDSDGFSANCGELGSDVCQDPGQPLHDVGLTGLALLAFLGDGSTMRRGAYKAEVTKAIRWLRQQQDHETGLIGEEIGREFLYDHAIAALALSEAFYFSQSPLLEGTVKKAMSYIMRARDPYGAWRYDVPSVGDADTSVTGWMLFALKSAEEAGIPVESGAFAGGMAWIDEVTDPANGRVGYDSFGSLSSRVVGINEEFAPQKTEAMTAVGLLCRFFLGQDPREHPIMEKHADLLLKTLPEWDPKSYTCDMYYWYYGSYAMYQMGGKHWTSWNKAMKKAVLESQRHEGDAKGSWDPVGPWGHHGGRVYSTALCILCLEVYFRYSKVLGGR